MANGRWETGAWKLWLCAVAMQLLYVRAVAPEFAEGYPRAINTFNGARVDGRGAAFEVRVQLDAAVDGGAVATCGVVVGEAAEAPPPTQSDMEAGTLSGGRPAVASTGPKGSWLAVGGGPDGQVRFRVATAALQWGTGYRVFVLCADTDEPPNYQQEVAVLDHVTNDEDAIAASSAGAAVVGILAWMYVVAAVVAWLFRLRRLKTLRWTTSIGRAVLEHNLHLARDTGAHRRRHGRLDSVLDASRRAVQLNGIGGSTTLEGAVLSLKMANKLKKSKGSPDSRRTPAQGVSLCGRLLREHPLLSVVYSADPVHTRDQRAVLQFSTMLGSMGVSAMLVAGVTRGDWEEGNSQWPGEGSGRGAEPAVPVLDQLVFAAVTLGVNKAVHLLVSCLMGLVENGGKRHDAHLLKMRDTRALWEALRRVVETSVGRQSVLGSAAYWLCCAGCGSGAAARRRSTGVVHSWEGRVVTPAGAEGEEDGHDVASASTSGDDRSGIPTVVQPGFGSRRGSVPMGKSLSAVEEDDAEEGSTVDFVDVPGVSGQPISAQQRLVIDKLSRRNCLMRAVYLRWFRAIQPVAAPNAGSVARALPWVVVLGYTTWAAVQCVAWAVEAGPQATVVWCASFGVALGLQWCVVDPAVLLATRGVRRWVRSSFIKLLVRHVDALDIGGLMADASDAVAVTMALQAAHAGGLHTLLERDEDGGAVAPAADREAVQSRVGAQRLKLVHDARTAQRVAALPGDVNASDVASGEGSTDAAGVEHRSAESVKKSIKQLVLDDSDEDRG